MQFIRPQNKRVENPLEKIKKDFSFETNNNVDSQNVIFSLQIVSEEQKEVVILIFLNFT